jgi:outer membrane protein assembly factor BamA
MLISSGLYKKVTVQLNDSLLEYYLEENDVYNGIKIRGNRLFPDSMLYKVIEYEDEGKTNPDYIVHNLVKIQDYYREHDYVLMKIKNISKTSDQVLNVQIDEGYIDSIRIEGNATTSDFIILRDFPLKQGDAYNSRLVKQGIENIYNTQLFEKVSVNVQRASDGLILLIKVKEKIFTVMRLGGKIGTERGAQAYFELGNDNLFGISSKMALTGRYGEYDRRIGLNYRMDRIFKTFLTFAIDGYYDWKLNPYYKSGAKAGEYREERSGIRFLIGQQLRKLGQMSVEFRLEHAKDVRYSGTFDLPQNSELRTLTIRSITDKRDRIAFATRGIYNVWYWEAGNQEIFEGQEKYTKAYVNLEGYYTYWNKHTFHLRGVIGVGDKTLPFSEFFRIGGPKSFMGFHQYELIGRQVIYTNLEYRYKTPVKLISDTYFGLRYDIGGIWETPDLVLTSEDFFSGIGVWLGIDTVLGPLKLHYGNSTLKDGIFYLSLGYDF